MTKNLGELAQRIHGTIKGDPGLLIEGVASLEDAGPHDISFLADIREKDRLENTRAGAVVVPLGLETRRCATIESQYPVLDFAQIVLSLIVPFKPSPGIHPAASIEKTAQIGRDVSIAAFCSVGERSRIGDRTVLFPQVYIGSDCEIGEDTVIYPQVVIRENVKIGKKVILHSGVVLGSDGFGYVQSPTGLFKIPQVGKVVIEDDVEIGANSTVDRAALGETLIKKGAKLDNLVHVGHNSSIGENSLLAAQVGLSGSVKIGDGVVMGGQAGVIDHLTIGNKTRVGAQSGVLKDIPGDLTVSGYPARPHMEALRILAALDRVLPLLKEMKGISDRIEKIENALSLRR